MYLRISCKNKIYKKNNSFPDSEFDPDPDPLVRGTDLRIRIRTNMSRILHTAWREAPASSPPPVGELQLQLQLYFTMSSP